MIRISPDNEEACECSLKLYGERGIQQSPGGSMTGHLYPTYRPLTVHTFVS